MKISDWLDKKEAEQVDVSQIVLPANMFYDQDPDETLFFKEINPCGFFAPKITHFLRSNALDTGYYCKGQDRKAGIHSSEMKWKLFTKDKGLALQTAKEHIE